MLDKKSIAINTGSQIIVRVITLVFALISVKLITNYLGTVGTGNYNSITTYINFFIVIADLGLFSVAVREISKKPEEEKKIISNVFGIRLVSALVASGIAILVVYFTPYSNQIKLGVVIGTGFLFFNLLSSVYDVVLQTRLKMQYSAIAEFLSKLISLVAVYLVIKNSGSFFWIVGTVALSGILIFIFKWLFSRKFVSFGIRYNETIVNWIFQLSWPIGIVFILNNLFFKIDTLLLFAIKGAAPVGIYSVAYKVLEVTIFAGAYFAASLKPALSQNIINNKDGVASIVGKSVIVMLLLAMPITILSIVFSKDIIVFLSNNDFISGSKALVILSLTLPFVYLDALLGEILIAGDQRKLLVKIAAFILSFNLILNLILIPRYSFIGAAYVTLISEIILMIVNIYYTKKIIHYKVRNDQVVKIFVISILTFIIGFLMKNILNIHFLLQMLILTLIFGILVYAFNLVQLKNIKNVMVK